MDVLELARAMVRRPSITPADAGAQAIVAAAATALGFECHHLPFGEGSGRVDNLVAVRPGRGPRFAFAGHTDVVPTGDATAWSAPPFDAALADGRLIGRGAADMKGAIAAFLAATHRHIGEGGDPELLLVITGDEEGAAVEGTARLMPWLAGRDLLPAAVLVGEPTSATKVGDTVKNGRRGSLNAWITVEGVQGHVAYPARADNPITRLVRILDGLKLTPLDIGTDWFEPSNLEVTRIEAGEPSATNVIPGRAGARLNIRFNDRHRGDGLAAWIERMAAEEGGVAEIQISGEAFLTAPGHLCATVAAAVEAITGSAPAFSTGGGTSDARFIRAYAPVVELGLVGATMHKIDESVPVADLHRLTDIYAEVLRRWFTAPGTIDGATPAR